jgi:hypothetical protein
MTISIRARRERRDDPEGAARVQKNAAELSVQIKTDLGHPIPQWIQHIVDTPLEDLIAKNRKQNAVDLEYILDIMNKMSVSFEDAEMIYDRRNGT